MDSEEDVIEGGGRLRNGLRNVSVSRDPGIQDMLQKAREATATKIKLDLATQQALEEERQQIQGKLKLPSCHLIALHSS